MLYCKYGNKKPTNRTYLQNNMLTATKLTTGRYYIDGTVKTVTIKWCFNHGSMNVDGVNEGLVTATPNGLMYEGYLYSSMVPLVDTLNDRKMEVMAF